MRNDRRLWAVDCETDPAKYGRVPKPFLWGAYDGSTFLLFRTTTEFVEWAKQQHGILYAHNGGKFDFMFLIIFVGQSKAQVINGRIVKMNLGKAEMRDSISIIPEALKKFGKSEIDYAKMEADVRGEHDEEIVRYLKQDCVVLYDLVSEYRRVAGKQITIAGNALKFSKKLGINPGRTNYTYDKNLRQFFFGGRCQVFKPGTHADIRVIDIHSAYPYAMTHDHASGAEWVHLNEKYFRCLSREEQQRCFIRIRCFSNGAFPKRGKTELNFPVGEDIFEITGWEYLAAVDLKLIYEVEILDVIMHNSVINFSPYVAHWYDYKSKHDKKTQPIQYTIGKIMMNSLYGKLAQNPLRYYDYKIMPAGSNICFDYEPTDKNICATCGEKDSDHGWSCYTEYENVEIHRRPANWKWEFKYGKAWEGQPLYNNVATGASITGFTRAHLLRAIHTVGIQHVIYCDTDSIICFKDADLSGLSRTDKLGDWGDEGTGSIGHFAAKKIYGIKMHEICKKYTPTPDYVCEKCGKPEKGHGNHPVIKIASKGSRLKFADIEALMRGEIINWKSPFPSFSVAGEPDFVVRNIRQTAKAIPPSRFSLE